MDVEIAKISETPIVTQILDTEYGELEIQNFKTPRKSLILTNSIDAQNVQNVFKNTLGNSEKTPNNKLTRLSDLEKRMQIQTAFRLESKKKLEFFARKSPKSYSLINLHQYLLGSLPAQSHGAEADCLTLLRTTAVLGIEWVQWVQDNSYLISKCRNMWSYSKL